MSFISLVVALSFLFVVAFIIGLLTIVECKLRALEEECKTAPPDVGIRVVLPLFVWRAQETRLRLILTRRPRRGMRISFRVIVREHGWVVTLLSEPHD